MEVYIDNKLLEFDIKLADTFIKRFIGLLGKKTILNNEGLLLTNCPSVHCFFMRFSIDVVYISKSFTVVGIETLKPWSIGSFIKDTAHILELSSGASKNIISIGDKISIQ